ncbi:hypothetical protein ACWGDS_29610 [Streptomyces sp. NPDC055059]
MSETVATTIITALVAFVASGLAALFALRGVREQLITQRALTAEDRAERREAERRTARRDAYAQFIAAAIRCAELIQQIRLVSPTEEGYADLISAIRGAVSDLVQAQAFVSVEGPAEVAAAATQARWALAQEFSAARAERAGTGSADQAARERRKAVGSMAEAARRAFGDGVGPPAAAPCISG